MPIEDIAAKLLKDPQGFDAKKDDPITRWSECLGRVVALVKANPGQGQVTRCVDAIEVCPSNEGGKGCCPAACVEKFKREIAAGRSEKEAMSASFSEGTCVKGFAEMKGRAR